MAESIKEGFETKPIVETSTNDKVEIVYTDEGAIKEEPKETGRFENLLSRKFLLSVLLFLCATYLFSDNKIDESVWMTISMFISGVYITGNVFQKGVTK